MGGLRGLRGVEEDPVARVRTAEYNLAQRALSLHSRPLSLEKSTDHLLAPVVSSRAMNSF